PLRCRCAGGASPACATTTRPCGLLSGAGGFRFPVERVPRAQAGLDAVRRGKGRSKMPEKKHVKGVGDKEQRMYEHIKESAQKSGRYGDRAEEVAARTVLKHHKEEGHAKGK